MEWSSGSCYPENLFVRIWLSQTTCPSENSVTITLNGSISKWKWAPLPREILDVNGLQSLGGAFLSLAAGQRRSSFTYWSWLIHWGLAERGNCSRGSHFLSRFLLLFLSIDSRRLPTSADDPSRGFTDLQEVLHTGYQHCKMSIASMKCKTLRTNRKLQQSNFLPGRLWQLEL